MTFEDEVVKTIGAAQSTFSIVIITLAEKVRETLILPLCKKNRLTFVSGMGTFFFRDIESKQVVHLGRDKQERLAYRILMTPVSDGVDLGEYVRDVKEGEL